MAKNKDKIQLKAKDIIGRRVLILGEVGSGKTTLTAKLLKELMLLVDPKEITVIDMAPQRVGEVGGKLLDHIGLTNKLRYLSPEKVYAPRLLGVSREQVLEYADLNKRAIDPLLDEFIQKSTRVLIINDITLYLHAGKLKKILDCVNLAETFLASAYYGSKLADDQGTGISNLEKQTVEKLATHMDQVIKINTLLR